MPASPPMDDVRAQYESLPYPSRDPRDEAIRLITGTPSHILEINHYLFSGRLNFIRPFRALVAGGGTGDACIMLAQQLVDRRCPGEVVYLDISTASRQICEQARPGARAAQHPVPHRLAARPAYHGHRPVRLHRLHRRAASSRRPGRRPACAVQRPAARRRRRRDALRRYGRSGVYPLQELLRTPGAEIDGARGPAGDGQAADPLPADHQPVPPQSLSQRPCDRRRCRAVRPAAAQLRSRLHGARHRLDGGQCRPAGRGLPRAGALRARHLHERSDHRAPGELAAADGARGLRRAGWPATCAPTSSMPRAPASTRWRGPRTPRPSRCCATWMRRSSPPACSPARRWSPISTASRGAPSCRRWRRASWRRSTAARRWPRSIPRSAPRAACRKWEDFYAQFEDLYVKLNGVNHLLLRFRT